MYIHIFPVQGDPEKVVEVDIELQSQSCKHLSISLYVSEIDGSKFWECDDCSQRFVPQNS